MSSKFSRRVFLIGSASLITSGLIAACGGTEADPTPATDTGAGAAAPTPTPAAAQPEATPEEPQESPTPVQADGTPQYGGELRIAQINDFVSMDPIHASGPTARPCYDWLTAWRMGDDGKFEVVPYLAESWEVFDDGIVFTLHDGVTFHDGSPLTAEVVAWNIARMAQTDGSFAAPHVAAVDPDNPAEATGELEVRVNLTRPSAAILSGLSDVFTTTAIVSQQAAEDNGEEWLKTNAVGSGPFTFVSWASGDRLVVARNDDYWRVDENGNQLPFADGATYRIIIEATTQFNEMRAGTTDYIENVPGRNVPAAREIEHATYMENPATGLKRQYFFNSRRPPFMDNLPLRQAIHHGINREALARALGGELGIPLPYEFAPMEFAYDESVPFYEYNPDRARELIAESGLQTPIPVRLTVHSREVDQRQAEMIQAMLAEIGVQINIEVLERVAWGEKVRINNDFEMATRQTGTRPDPTQDLFVTWAEGGHSAFHRAHVPGLFDVLNQADVEFDPQRRRELFVEAQRLMHESAWFGYMWFEKGNVLVHNRIHGFSLPWGSLREAEWWIDE